MKKYIHQVVLVLFATTLFVSCKRDSPNNTNDIGFKEPNLPTSSYDYEEAAKKVSRSSSTNVKNEVATLGRVLFYERQLSVNNLISCGSCHVQSMGFADGRQFSPGFEFLQTPRNSPGIVNPSTMRNFFWDARAKDGLRDMVLMPVQNHLEMGIENLNYVVAKIEAIPYYKELFLDAYGSEKVTKDKIAQALEQFLASMAVTQTKFDENRPGNTSLNSLEEQGFNLFNSLHCGSCHSLSINGSWQSDVFANIGLDMTYSDDGVFSSGVPQFNNENYRGAFKTPNLRNIALTAPYMHDGRFATLEEVIEHYNSGVKPHKSLSWALTNSHLELMNQGRSLENQRPIIGEPTDPAKLSLTELEKSALVAFLKTLTDEEFIRNPMYSDPFAY
jgi:cytochrome c peroxidase